MQNEAEGGASRGGVACARNGGDSHDQDEVRLLSSSSSIGRAVASGAAVVRAGGADAQLLQQIVCDCRRGRVRGSAARAGHQGRADGRIRRPFRATRAREEEIARDWHDTQRLLEPGDGGRDKSVQQEALFRRVECVNRRDAIFDPHCGEGSSGGQAASDHGVARRVRLRGAEVLIRSLRHAMVAIERPVCARSHRQSREEQARAASHRHWRCNGFTWSRK